jgi:protein phosphatase
MKHVRQLCQHDDLLFATPFHIAEPDEEASRAPGITWWEEMTLKRGGEGPPMVGEAGTILWRAGQTRGLLQRQSSVAGRNTCALSTDRSMTCRRLARCDRAGWEPKRSLALREFSLSIEALERFVKHEPLRRVHECVFGVLALESEPVDPRL